MARAARPLVAGILLILGAIALDLAGGMFQSLLLLILSFALAIAGAIVAIRSLVEFLSERMAQ